VFGVSAGVLWADSRRVGTCRTGAAVARRWLYEHRLILLRERDLRMMIIKVIREHEAGLARTIVEGIAPSLLAHWRARGEGRANGSIADQGSCVQNSQLCSFKCVIHRRKGTGAG
jgi:hypothetical protein